jgi:uncharacterized protein YcgL (UPF0745 family)
MLNQGLKELITLMLCTIYKSLIKADTYLYIAKRSDFSKVPEKLLETFGKPVFAMIINFDKHSKLARADRDRVIEQINQSGYYLQLPPPPNDLLKPHLAANKIKAGNTHD